MFLPSSRGRFASDNPSTLSTVLGRLRNAAPADHQAWIILARLADVDWFAWDSGPVVFQRAMNELRNSGGMFARELRRDGFAATSAAFGIHGVAVYVALPPGQDAAAMAAAFEKRLVHSLPVSRAHLKVSLASAGPLGDMPPASLERALRLTYDRSNQGLTGFSGDRLELASLLDSRNLRILYQPIVSLRDGSVFGHEALTRGPAGSPLEYPDRLFPAAEREGLLLPLERTCRELALMGFVSSNSEERLFLNMNPAVLQDEAFQGGFTLQLVRQLGLRPSQVIFEVTERQAVTDFRVFRQALEHYRRQGFQIAVDDAGAGYSSLQSITELRPDIIKVDISMVHGINRSAVKRSLFTALASVARTIGAKIIAEGIETRGELATVIQLGGDLGQGYYLGRPGAIGTPPSSEAQRALKSVRRVRFQRQGLTLGDIVEETPVLPPEAPVREASALFEKHELIDGFAVVNEASVAGLVMRGKFFQALGQPFGVALYHDRPLELLLDGHPLILDLSTSLDDAAEVAMARPPHQVYDHVVVTDDSSYAGVVSVRLLLESINDAHRRERRPPRVVGH